MPSIDVPLIAPIAVDQRLWRHAHVSCAGSGVRACGLQLVLYRHSLGQYHDGMIGEASVMARDDASFDAARRRRRARRRWRRPRRRCWRSAIDQSPAGLDPHIITAFSSFMVVNGTIYEGLTAIDKDLRVGPGVAESWTVAPDGKTYTFKIRSGVTFHNGAPVEAADVVASLKRVLTKEIASPLASRLAAVDTITATDATRSS